MLATFGGLWFLVTSVWAWWFIFSPVFDLFSRWCNLRIAMKTFFLICPCSFLYWHHNMENRWNAQSEWTDYNAAAWLFMDSGSDFYKKWILKRKWPSFFLNCLFIEQCKMLTLRSCDLQKDLIGLPLCCHISLFLNWAGTQHVATPELVNLFFKVISFVPGLKSTWSVWCLFLIPYGFASYRLPFLCCSFSFQRAVGPSLLAALPS